jgi:UDP-glucose 4-epimerase
VRVVVTGATGNVGTQVVRQLLEHSAVDRVVGLARRPPVDPGGVTWHAADIGQDDLRRAFDGADAVIHLAWLLQPSHDEPKMVRTNVHGTQRVLEAVQACGVPALVHASSVGAYSPGPKDQRVPESHPTDGIATSPYSRHKAAAERLLNDAEPGLRLVRIRPGLVFQAAAASAIARYFLGRFVPQSLVRRSFLPVIPDLAGLVIQGVHAEDVAAAFVTAATTPASGAFNVAAEPLLDVPALREALGARSVPMPRWLARGVLDLTWRAHLQPTDPGWLDLALQVPLMETTRAWVELGWAPRHEASDALVELVDAMGRKQGGATPVLRPR